MSHTIDRGNTSLVPPILERAAWQISCCRCSLVYRLFQVSDLSCPPILLLLVLLKRQLHLRIKHGSTHHTIAMQPELRQHQQDTQAVDHATAEIDRGGFRKIPCCNRHFLKIQSAHHTLRNDFSIKDEIIAVIHETHSLQIFA